MNYIIFGNGYRARMIADELAALNIRPLATVTDIGEGLSPQQAQALYPDAEYILAVYNDNEPRCRLSAMGLRCLSVWDVYQRHGGDNFSEYEMMRGINQDDPDIERAAGLFTDKQSRDLYRALIAWRASHDDAILPAKRNKDDTYFDIPLTDAEVFVDCGAYNGDTVRKFIQRTGGQYKSIYAFEPNADNLSQIQGDYRLHKLPLVVGARRGVAKLQAGRYDSAASRVSDDGQAVTMIPLDMLSCDPTLIKMDIEGSEQAALRGARQIIRRCLPKLAITLYHHPEDLYQIPLLIHDIVPAYKFKLRKYADACWEVVLYAYV